MKTENEQIENNDKDNGYAINIKEETKNITQFAKFNRFCKITEKFDKDKITIKRKGKFINAHDYTQSGREGTEIYETLKKYKDVPMTMQAMRTNAKELSGQICEIGDLRKVLDNKIKCEKMWENMNPEIKKQFGNNMEEFLQHGEDWCKNMLKEKANSKKGENE